MKIAITGESTIDLSKELLDKFQIKTVPFTVTLGNKTATDGEITSEEIINYVSENNVLPKTSAVNYFQYTEFFGELKKTNDAIIHFTLSSEMSSAYSNAVEAAKEFENVYVIDSRTLSTGIALLAMYARKLADKGLTPEEIVPTVMKRIPNDQTSFVLYRTDYLYRGGRCSSISNIAATLLKIRPQIIVNDGKMGSHKKYMGKMNKCIEKYVEDILAEYNTPDLEEIFITSTTATPEQILMVKDMLVKRGFKNINITYAGATITSHCGENCLGILYLNDGDANGMYTPE